MKENKYIQLMLFLFLFHFCSCFISHNNEKKQIIEKLSEVPFCIDSIRSKLAIDSCTFSTTTKLYFKTDMTYMFEPTNKIIEKFAGHWDLSSDNEFSYYILKPITGEEQKSSFPVFKINHKGHEYTLYFITCATQ